MALLVLLATAAETHIVSTQLRRFTAKWLLQFVMVSMAVIVVVMVMVAVATMHMLVFFFPLIHEMISR